MKYLKFKNVKYGETEEYLAPEVLVPWEPIGILDIESFATASAPEGGIAFNFVIATATGAGNLGGVPGVNKVWAFTRIFARFGTEVAAKYWGEGKEMFISFLTANPGGDVIDVPLPVLTNPETGEQQTGYWYSERYEVPGDVLAYKPSV